ncbi:hypothetical protein AHAS_Ahas08G0072900 [Arachis hypogaea]|uniref:DUF4283 domain-containing protein n=1 Tax=Arachis hypogaea TaxID=3818 RepID=A0A445BVM7_ARAHY|nr:hypothetical protein Ahy_A08g039224 [Arachis hypogaea]
MRIENSLHKSEKRSQEEEDLKDRSTKKVKMDAAKEEGAPMEGVVEVILEEDSTMKGVQTESAEYVETSNKSNEQNKGTKASYKDMVMANGLGDSLNIEDIVQMISEDYESEFEKDKLAEEPLAPFNPKPVIKVSLEEYDEWCRPWKFSLIVKPLGKKISLPFMERWVTRRWAKQSTINVTDLEEIFFIRFHAHEDYAYALFEGPWMITDHYLLVQRWRPLFFSHEMGIQKVAVWVCIPNLLAELYNRFFLGKVGNSLGTMLKINGHTSIHSRGKFARICVEVDLRQQLVPSFSSLGKDFRLEYEGLHIIYFNCGRYRHRKDDCPELSISDTNGVSTPERSPSDLPEYSIDKRLEQPHAKEDQNQSQKGKERIEGENLAANQESKGQDISKDTPQIMAIKDQQQSSPFGSWM